LYFNLFKGDIKMLITYEDFSGMEEYEKISFMEDWFTVKENVAKTSEKQLKIFFRSVLEEEQNGFLLIKSIETLSFLTLINKMRKTSTVDMLLDIETCEKNPFVNTTALKYLTVFYDNDEDILDVIKTYRDSSNAEISSEAYFQLGLIKFLKTNFDNNILDYLQLIEESQKYFTYSQSLIENRTDAEYFKYITSFIVSLIKKDNQQVETSYRKLLDISFVREAFHFDKSLVVLEYKIHSVLMNLKLIIDKINDGENWISYFDEFNKLSLYHNELINISISTNNQQHNLLTNFKDNITENILKTFYIKNLSYYEKKINILLDQFIDDSELTIFLRYVKKLMMQNDKKKEDQDQIMRTCIKISSIVEGVDVVDLVKQFSTSRDINSIDDILECIGEYTNLLYDKNIDFVTGFPQGEEIYTEIMREVVKNTPNYPQEKLVAFGRVMEELIRYLILTVRSERSENYNFLYTKDHKGKGADASERDLQSSLYDHFQRSNIAYSALEEINNFSDGGRIDIVIQLNNVTFPIELKKTKQKITDEKVRDKYLEQLNSYIYSYDQLGIFVLLDLNKKTKPVNDVRELVYLDHLEPLYTLKNKYPDNIVVVIIPGNKPLPSDKSTYR